MLKSKLNAKKCNNRSYKITADDFIMSCSNNKSPYNANPMLVNDKTNGDDRIKNIKFHIKSSDYFGTLASILNLIRQTNRQKNKYPQKIQLMQNKLFKNLKNDLLFLQENYKIVKKRK